MNMKVTSKHSFRTILDWEMTLALHMSSNLQAHEGHIQQQEYYIQALLFTIVVI